MGLFRPNVQKMRQQEDVPGLMKALDDKAWYVRMDSAKALAGAKDENRPWPLPSLCRRLRAQVRPPRAGCPPGHGPGGGSYFFLISSSFWRAYGMSPPASTMAWRAGGSGSVANSLPLVLLTTLSGRISSSSPSSASSSGQITVRRPRLIEFCRKMRE